MEVRGMLLGEVMPCTAMVVMEACTIGLTILASTIMARGLSPFVFVVYTNVLASLILFPYSFMYHRDSREQPLFSLPLLLRFFFLGFIGIAIAQNLAFVGLSYSSPIVACGMGNLLPSFSFILAILLRTTKIDWRSSSSQAKCIGTLVSVMGAISLTLYKGPAIKSAASHQFRLEPRLFVFSSTHEHWILGAILFAAASLTLSIWNIIQVGTIKHYPEVMPALSLYSSVGTIQSALLSVLFERNLSAWRLKLNMELFIIVSTAIFGSVIRSRVHVWCTSMKGPFYVPSFKPLGIPIASICGCLFFADSFHYGSIVGACITGIGYYTVMWGQIREDETSKSSGDVEAPEKEVPLLQEATEV